MAALATLKLKAVESKHRREWSHWIEDEKGKVLAAVVERDGADALARLFEAAPELLTACEFVVGVMPSEEVCDSAFLPAYRAVTAAIARAKGGA